MSTQYPQETGQPDPKNQAQLKEKQMKYYLGRIEEYNGDMEYTDKFLFATDGDPDEHMKQAAKEWRGCTDDDWDEDHEAYWADQTLVASDGWREIPKEDFDVLAKYIAVL
jgi:hypothetical protein